MKKLAEKGSDIFVTNKEKINVLHLAIYKNKINIVKMLLQSNFPLDCVTINGYNAIQLAAILCRTEIMEVILNYLRD
jgi:ankyrin repeat protein